ncbi:MAG: hypothetical protein R3C02_18745 [Planctomycetaceae bacterium]
MDLHRADPGQYRVSATWTEHPDRAKNSPFSFYDGVTAYESQSPISTVRVDQKIAPDDFVAAGSDWEDLLVVDVTGDTLIVELTDDANLYVIADAIRIEEHPPQRRFQ